MASSFIIQKGPGIASKAYNYAKKLFKGGKEKTTGTEVVQPFQYKKGRSSKELAVLRAEIESKKKNKKFLSDIEKSFTGLDEARTTLRQTGQRIAGEPVTKSGVSKGANIKNPKPIKKAKGGRVGLKRGTGLMKKKSNVAKIKKTFGPKSLGMQSVIYGLDKNKNVTAADPKAKFIAAAKKKNRMKAAFGGGADMGKVASDKTKTEVKKYEKRAKDASKFLKNKGRSFGSMMREKYMR